MKVLRGLARRIALAAAVCAVGGVLPVGIAASLTAAKMTGEAILTQANPAIELDTARCLAADGAFHDAGDGGVQVYSYDVATGLSPHPDAPALVPKHLERVQQGAPSSMRLAVGDPSRGGSVLVRTRVESGPCSALALYWPATIALRQRLLGRLMVLGVLALMSAIVAGQMVAIRPLVRRLQVLARSASGVGQSDFTPGPQGPDDAIEHVRVSLGSAHARIQASERALLERQHALERHLGNVAHDLRTPLAGMQLQLEAIAQGRGDAQSLARDALQELSYLTALTENLRQAARLQEGVHPLAGDAQVDLGGVVRRVQARFAPLARIRGVQVLAAHPDEMVPVHCDPAMAEQVVANLVANAVKAVPDGGHVAIGLEVERGRFELFVLDDGPGIPLSVRERVGQRHNRGPQSLLDARHGTGLGLAIVTEICDQADWRVSFQDAEPGGTRIELAGPLAE